MNTDNVSAGSRPWYRLHASSWFVFLAALVFIGVLIASGFICFEPRQETRSRLKWRHGWPLTFLIRDTGWGPFHYDDYISRDHLSMTPQMFLNVKPKWKFTQDVRSFKPLVLAADIFLSVMLACSVALAWERRRRRSHWLRFNLRELIVGMIVVSVLFGYWRHLRTKQQESLALIHRYSSMAIAVEHRLPEWLWDWLPNEPIKLGDRVRDVAMLGIPIETDDIRRLATFSDVQRLFLYPRPVGNIDAAAHWIGDLRQLICLNVGHAGFTAAGLAEFEKLQRLEVFEIRSEVDDEGLMHVSKLPRLESLSLLGCLHVTDTGLASISKLQRLKQLKLNGCDYFSAAGMSQLANLSQLESLDIQLRIQYSNPDVLRPLGEASRKRSFAVSSRWDEELLPLARLPRLARLKLGAHHITDRGLEILASFPALQSLTLNVATLSDEGLAKLRAARPELAINLE